MFRKIHVAVTFFIVISSASLSAQSLETAMRQLSETGDDEAIFKVLCKPMLETEHDLGVPNDAYDGFFIPISRGGTEPACTAFGALRLIDAEVTFATGTLTTGLGVDLLESTNRWRWIEGSDKYLFLISVINPYSVNLSAITVNYSDGDCPAATSESHTLLFDQPIKPKETVIVRAELPYETLAKSGCLDIVGAETELLGEASQIQRQILPLARAGQWLDAVLLSETVFKSTLMLPDDLKAELRGIIESGVRPLPSAESIENYLGYSALVALDSSNQSYLDKQERYRVASIEDRQALTAQAMVENLPFVTHEEVFAGLSSKQSRVQRDEIWAQFEGKTMNVTGRVSDVKPEGLLLPASIILDVSGGNQVRCFLKDFLADAASTVRVGSEISCVGKLSNYNLLFGIVTVALEDSEFEK